MLEEVEQVVEGSREDNGAISVEKVKDRTREVEVRGLNHLSAPELEDRINGEDNLEEWECLGGRTIFKDVLTPYGEEGDKFQSIGEEIRTVESSMGEGGWDIGVFDGSEVPEPPEIESRVGERRIWKGEVTGGGMKGVRSRSAHWEVRSKRERR